MTDEPYADPAVRAALGSLLLDEPPAPPVVDDVSRGRARRRRRRARVGAGAALAAVAVVAAAIVGLPGSVTTGAPATSQPARSADQALDVAKQRLEPYLQTLGWTIVADNRPTMPEGSDHAVLSLGVARTGGLGDDDPLVTELRVLAYPSAPSQGYTLAGCTAQTCTPVPAVVDDCAEVPDCATTRGALPRASVGRLDWGSLILDRTFRYAGSGQLVELVVGEDPAAPAVAALGPVPFLDVAGASDLLDVLGNPFGAPVPAATGPSCRDRDVKLVPAVDQGAVRGTRSMIVEVHARNPQVRCILTGTPALQLLDADDRPLPFTVVPDPSSPATPVLVTQDRTPAAVLVLRQPTCLSDVVMPASSLRVTLPGETAATLVEVPDGLAPLFCVDRTGDPGLTVTVSPFRAGRAGGAPTAAPSP